MGWRSSRVVAAGLAVCAVVGGTAAAARVGGVACAWSAQALPMLAGGVRAQVLGVDAGGTVWSGLATTASDQGRAVLWRDGRMIALDDGPDTTFATDVNRSGVAVGERLPSGGAARVPVMWRSPGTSVTLTLPPGASSGAARGINDAGLIVGVAFFGTPGHAVVWSADHPDQVTDLGTGGSTSAQLAGVSETGVLAGQTRTVPVAALTGTVAGGLHRLAGATPGSGTTAVAAAGRYIVGTESTANDPTAAVRWDADTGQVLSRLRFPNTGLTPTAVNRAGQVAVAALVWSPPGHTWLAPASAAPTANAIADDGRVGGRSLRDGHQVATIWTCVPAHSPVRAPRAG